MSKIPSGVSWFEIRGSEIAAGMSFKSYGCGSGVQGYGYLRLQASDEKAELSEDLSGLSMSAFIYEAYAAVSPRKSCFGPDASCGGNQYLKPESQ